MTQGRKRKPAAPTAAGGLPIAPDRASEPVTETYGDLVSILCAMGIASPEHGGTAAAIHAAGEHPGRAIERETDRVARR